MKSKTLSGWVTPKQLKLLKNLGIKHYKNISCEEANQLIIDNKELDRLDTWSSILRLESMLKDLDKKN